MPIYDYRCDHCGHVFSAVQSFNDEALEKCPNCGKRPRRLLSTPAIVFKGSGWYKTDSRPAQKGEDAAPPPVDAKTTEKSKTETKAADSKPADSKAAETKSAEAKPRPKSEAAS